jgi:large subunit ribosomal protein L3
MAVTGILGKKIGMTQVFDEKGDVHPITVLQAGPCVITQLKTAAKDGYDAAQIGLVEFVKASRMTKAQNGHLAKTEAPPVRADQGSGYRSCRRWRAGDQSRRPRAGGHFQSDAKFVDVMRHLEGPRVCGRGAQAPFRRRSQVARAHVPGAGLHRRFELSVAGVSRSAHAWPHGNVDQVTVRNLRIRGIDLDENLLMVEGAVPGPREGYVLISKAKAPPRERRGFAGSGTLDPLKAAKKAAMKRKRTGRPAIATCGAEDSSRLRRSRRKKKTMAKVDVVDLSGKKVGSLELADECLAPEQVNEALLWEAVKHYRASLRQGTAARPRTASWSPVRARSCGSRRARAGRVSDRCVRRCGGMAARCTGQPRSYEYAFPRKKLLGALRSALASKLADGKLTVVDSLEIKEGKTKLYARRWTSWTAKRTALLVENGKTLGQALLMGARNLEGRGAGAEQRGAPLRPAAL